MVAALAVLAGMAALGIAVLERFARFLRPIERWAYGVPLGMVIGTLPIVPLASVLGFSAALVGLTVLAEGAIAVLLVRPVAIRLPRVPAVRELRRHGRWLPFVVLGLLTARWAVTWSGAIVETSNGLIASHVNLWGDWPVHLGNVASFAYAGNFPPTHPRFAGTSFGYHYLSDLTAAMLVPFGLEPGAALSLHSFVLCVAVAVGLYVFARRLTGSPLAASLAVILFLYGGNLAWLLTASAIDESGDLLGTLTTKAWDFHWKSDYDFWWVNMFWGFWAPQRAFLYGLPIAFVVLRTTSLAHRLPGYLRWLIAGVIGGLLPLAHLGTLLALAMVVPVLFLLRPSRGWIVFGLVWVAVALPQLLLIGGGGAGALSAARLQFGWVAGADPLWFYLKNLGPFLALLPVALFTRVVPDRGRRLLGAFMVIFVAANLAVFQPWDWDNHKILVWWFLATAILVGALLARAWERGGPPARALVVGALGVMLLSGALEDLGQALGQSRYQMIDRDGVAMGRRIRDDLPPRARFVTGMRNQDVAQMVAGRQLVVGHDDWLWAEGLPFEARRADVIRILRLEPDTDALLTRYAVDYVLIGPYERDEHGADPAAWAARYPVVLEVGDYRVFDVRRATAGG